MVKIPQCALLRSPSQYNKVDTNLRPSFTTPALVQVMTKNLEAANGATLRSPKLAFNRCAFSHLKTSTKL